MTIRISFSDKTVRVAVEINGAIESAITELPQRTWVGLTAEEKSGKRPLENGLLFNSAEAQAWEIAVDYAEAKLKEKNT